MQYHLQRLVVLYINKIFKCSHGRVVSSMLRKFHCFPWVAKLDVYHIRMSARFCFRLLDFQRFFFRRNYVTLLHSNLWWPSHVIRKVSDETARKLFVMPSGWQPVLWALEQGASLSAGRNHFLKSPICCQEKACWNTWRSGWNPFLTVLVIFERSLR